MKVSEFFKSPDLLKWFVNNGIALLVLLFTMTLLYKYFDMRIDQIKEEDEFILQEKMDKASKLDLGKYIVVQGELKTGGYTNTVPINLHMQVLSEDDYLNCTPLD